MKEKQQLRYTIIGFLIAQFIVNHIFGSKKKIEEETKKQDKELMDLTIDAVFGQKSEK